MNTELKNINREEALRYMGHRGEVPESLNKTLDECEQRLLDVIHPEFIFRVFGISPCPDGVKVEGSSLILKGEDIRSHIDGCERAVLMCATLGGDTDRLIRTAEVSDISSAFITDALASAAIEDVCRIADKYISEQLPECYFTWRFSPGYGDFPIDIQKGFLETLNAPKRIGLCTAENNILIPRKSVTAVSGVSDTPLPEKKRGCVRCNMADRCVYRKRGEHCGF